LSFLPVIFLLREQKFLLREQIFFFCYVNKPLRLRAKKNFCYVNKFFCYVNKFFLLREIFIKAGKLICLEGVIHANAGTRPIRAIVSILLMHII
jgi:hypothetical protein